MIGWDGASWDLIIPMLEAGKLRNLSALMQRGAYGPMASFQPTLSPVLWTTVATGMTPAVHGIRGFDGCYGIRDRPFHVSQRPLRTAGHFQGRSSR